MLTVTFPCGPVRWTLITPLAFLISKRVAGVRVRSLPAYLSQRHKRMEAGREGKHSLGHCNMFSRLYCAVLLVNFPIRGKEKVLLTMHIKCLNKNHDLLKVTLSRSSLLWTKWQALPSLSEDRSFGPENEISAPLWKHCHCLWVTSQFPTQVSNHVLCEGKSGLVSF